MGLDACVYCDCYERGRLRTPPPIEVTLHAEGALEAAASNTEVGRLIDFDAWRVDACEHEDGIAIHHRLGNLALVGLLREQLGKAPERFPLILSRVVHSGTHAGDHIEASLLPALSEEVDRLAAFHVEKRKEEAFLRRFEQQLRELLAVARALGKPIAF